MKVSLNWIKQFTDIDIPVKELEAKIGAQLGAVEEVTDLSQKYHDILIAKVITCEKHPNADQLMVCMIDDGGVAQGIERNNEGLIQVVCGAPNVRAGINVAWIPPGAVVPSTSSKDPFVLESRQLRGVVSNGMLASASELDIGDDHSGIVILDTPAAPGASFAEAYELNDFIFDIENKMFTHRPDCFGILGVAREIAGITGKKFESPDWYEQTLGRIKPGKSKMPLEVENKAGNLVPRFMAVAMNDIRVTPSPFLIQTYLSRVGIKPINNIVDVTNYVMYLTGQPLHAYDADKLRGVSGNLGMVKLEARLSRPGDKIKLLGGKELELDDEDTILITSNDVPVGIGGVMGGAETEVDENTQNIVLECANFDMYSVRRTSMKYGLFTDAVTRFNKGQSALQNDKVLEEAIATIQYVSSAQIASEVIDVKQELPEAPRVETNANFINNKLGSELSVEEVKEILTNVEFEVEAKGESLAVRSPFWRTDIEIPEDIVEEVGRLYGYDNLPKSLPARTMRPAAKDKLQVFQNELREILSQYGANEILTYSFVHGDLLENSGQDKTYAYKLSNAISPELQYFRISLTPSLLEKLHANVKSGYDRFAIFELGKVHNKSITNPSDNDLPIEQQRLAFTYADDNHDMDNGAIYFAAKNYLDELLEALSVSDARFARIDDRDTDVNISAWDAPFDLRRSAKILIRSRENPNEDILLGIVGEYNKQIARKLKLPQAAGFELDVSALMHARSDRQYRPVSRFPKIHQDITLRVSKDQDFQPLYKAILSRLEELTEDGSYQKSLQPIDIFQKEDYKNLTFRLSIASYDTTLRSSEVNSLLDNLATDLSDQFDVERV